MRCRRFGPCARQPRGWHGAACAACAAWRCIPRKLHSSPHGALQRTVLHAALTSAEWQPAGPVTAACAPCSMRPHRRRPHAPPPTHTQIKSGCVVCPAHGTAFALGTGEVKGEWCPKVRRCHTYRIRIWSAGTWLSCLGLRARLAPKLGACLRPVLVCASPSPHSSPSCRLWANGDKKPLQTALTAHTLLHPLPADCTPTFVHSLYHRSSPSCRWLASSATRSRCPPLRAASLRPATSRSTSKLGLLCDL